MTWVAVAITVGSTLVGGYEQGQVSKKQDSTLAAQMQQQMATQKKVAGNTANLVAQEKASTAQPAQDAAQAAYTQELNANKAQASQPLQQQGNVSDAYKKDAQDAALGVANSTSTRSGLMSSIAAPQLQRQGLQKTFDNYNISNNQLNQQQSGQNSLDQLNLQAIHANPWASLLTGVGSAYAKGVAANNMGSLYNGPSTSIGGNTALGGIDLSGGT